MTGFVGIDPGVSGALALVSGGVCLAQPLGNMTLRQVLDWLQEVRQVSDKAMLEHVTGYTSRSRKNKDGSESAHGGQPGSLMFRFGQSYGQLEALLVATGFRYEVVPGSKWQGEVGLVKVKGEDRASHKRRLKELALTIFPESLDRITLDTCDAILLAEACRRRWEDE